MTASATETIQLNNSTIPANWEVKGYSFNDLLDAYARGRDEQAINVKQEIIKKLNDNIDRAASIIETIYHKIKNDFKISIKLVSLKIDSVTAFEALISVDRDEYVTDKFLEVYNFARDMKKQNNTDNFSIAFIFMPFSEDLNIDCIHSDGFILEYAKK